MVLGGLALGIIAIFLPPLTVFIRRGCGADILINLLLCLLAWFPGVIHAWYIVAKYPSLRQRHKERRRDERVVERREERRYSSGGGHHHGQQGAGHHYGGHGHGHGHGGYGAQQGGYAPPPPPPQYGHYQESGSVGKARY